MRLRLVYLQRNLHRPNAPADQIVDPDAKEDLARGQIDFLTHADSLLPFLRRRRVDGKASVGVVQADAPWIVRNLRELQLMVQAAVGQRSAHSPQWTQTFSSFTMTRPVWGSGAET